MRHLFKIFAFLFCTALAFAQSVPIKNATLQGTLNGTPTGGTLNLGSVTVSLGFTDGSTSAPGIKFSSDTDTGFYRIGANNLGITAGNTIVGAWSTTGLSLGSPIATAVGSAASPILTVGGTGDGFYTPADHQLGIGIGGNSVAVMSASTLTLGTNVALAFAGTGAATTATNLGLGTASSPQFTGIELGHATDTTITRGAAGRIAVEGVNVATTSDKLSAFAATTSAELAGVISDETGTGSLVFGTSPTFTTQIVSPIFKGTSTDVVMHDGAGNVCFRGIRASTWTDSASAQYFQVGSQSGNTVFTTANAFSAARMAFFAASTQFSNGTRAGCPVPTEVFEIISSGNAKIFGVSNTGATTLAGALSAPSATIGSGTQITAIYSASATLDFPNIAATGGVQDLTITVTGAATGNVVSIGLPPAPDAGVVFNAFVSASNTVTVRATNTTGAGIDPASASYRVQVTKF